MNVSEKKYVRSVYSHHITNEGNCARPVAHTLVQLRLAENAPQQIAGSLRRGMQRVPVDQQQLLAEVAACKGMKEARRRIQLLWEGGGECPAGNTNKGGILLGGKMCRGDPSEWRSKHATIL